MPSIADQVIDFYGLLFERVFCDAFRPQIEERLKRNKVVRQVEEAADAASQSLSRFFLNQNLVEQDVAEILGGFGPLYKLLKLDDIANSNATPESLVDGLKERLPVPKAVQEADHEPIYRVGLHSLVQVLMLVGPVMAEWQKLNFSSTFELPRRIVDRLNQISGQLNSLGRSGDTAADEIFDLTYRDYLLQRFHRVEAGTVRMTTNLDVDLRELFVMPRVRARPIADALEGQDASDAVNLMNLKWARAFFGASSERQGLPQHEEGISALEQVKTSPRLTMSECQAPESRPFWSGCN